MTKLTGPKTYRLWLILAIALMLPATVIFFRLARRESLPPGTQFIEGVHDLSDSGVTLIRIPFSTVQLEIRTGSTQRLAWSCDLGLNSRLPKVVVEAGIATLDLKSLRQARCLISVPTRTGVEIRGQNAYLKVERPSTDLDIAFNTGRVQIAADPKCAYDFDVNVKTGDHDSFPRSRSPDAVHVKVSLNHGTVKRR